MTDPTSVTRQPEATPVIEYFVSTRKRWGTRVYATGESDEWTDELGWRPLVRLPSEEVAALLELARELGFFEMPALLEPQPPPDDGTTISWTIELEDRRHTVIARGLSEPNFVLKSLNDRLQIAVGESLNRAANDVAGDATS